MRKAYFSDVDEVTDDYDDEWFNSDDDDPELKEIRDKKTIVKEAIDAELQVLKANVVDEGRESNDEGGVEHYQNSDNVDSQTDDSGVDHDDHTTGKKRKRKMREKTPQISWTFCCQN